MALEHGLRAEAWARRRVLFLSSVGCLLLACFLKEFLVTVWPEVAVQVAVVDRPLLVLSPGRASIDPWGRDWQVSGNDLYSIGPNGVDECRLGDDVVVDPRRKPLAVLVATLLPGALVVSAVVLTWMALLPCAWRDYSPGLGVEIRLALLVALGPMLAAGWLGWRAATPLTLVLGVRHTSLTTAVTSGAAALVLVLAMRLNRRREAVY